MKILYVTTFNQRLYDLTGKNLISTFLEMTSVDDNLEKVDLFVCHEEMEFHSDSDRILTFDINESSYFTNWIKKIIIIFLNFMADLPKMMIHDSF